MFFLIFLASLPLSALTPYEITLHYFFSIESYYGRYAPTQTNSNSSCLYYFEILGEKELREVDSIDL